MNSTNAMRIAALSGSLYLLAVPNLRWLGIITPVGGVSFIAGWLWPFVSAAKPGAGDKT
jgi:uncharacterized membrane protein YgdD (TMEM256/DUF423 family)